MNVTYEPGGELIFDGDDERLVEVAYDNENESVIPQCDEIDNKAQATIADNGSGNSLYCSDDVVQPAP